MQRRKIEKGVELILEGLLGPAWKSDRNYVDTPRRVADLYAELFRERPYGLTTFPEAHNQMVVLAHHKDATFCPHHLLPVLLDVSVGYIPSGEVLGLSKLARLIQAHFSEPILQEDLTDSIADELQKRTGALGVGVYVVGVHMCMRIRGPKTSGCVVTSAMRGAFLEKPEVRHEFLSIIQGVKNGLSSI